MTLVRAEAVGHLTTDLREGAATPSGGGPGGGLPFHVPITRLHFKPNVPAGMDPCVLLGLVPRMRRTTEDYEPIRVERSSCCTDGCWTVHDGRHRWVAAVIAGRQTVLAEEV